MSGVHDQHGMKFETDWSWLDVPDARQHQRGNHLAIAQAMANSMRNFLQQPVARSLFKQFDQTFDFRPQLNRVRLQFRLVGGNARQPRKKSEIANTKHRARETAGFEKPSAWQRVHGLCMNMVATPAAVNCND